MYITEILRNITKMTSNINTIKSKSRNIYNVGFVEEPEENETSMSGAVATNSTMYAVQDGHFHTRKRIPFNAHWAFGVGTNVKPINLTKKKSCCKLFYAASHVGIIYDDTSKHMHFLMGHTDKIISTSASCTGKWIASADAVRDHCIIIWDSEECIPVHTIFEPFPEKGIEMICISHDAKFLISIGRDSTPSVKFWAWTFGNQTPDGTYDTKIEFGDIRSMRFNPHISTHMVLTFTDAVVFLTWENGTLKNWEPDLTKLKLKNYGYFNDTIYVEDSYECFSTTTKGWVIVWGISFFHIPYDSVPPNNEKIFIKAIRLQKESIDCIESIDNVIATGDGRGRIQFYDKKLKILYWCQNFHLSGIYALSFNLILDDCKQKTIYLLDNHQLEEDAKSRNRSFDDLYYGQKNKIPEEDRSIDYQSIYTHLLPKDYSLQQEPFYVRDFVVVTNKGEVAYVDFLANKINSSISPPCSVISSIDVHEEKSLLCVGFKNGQVSLFNYLICKLICTETIMNSKEEEYNEITCVKYSSHGLFLACGTGGGHFWFLDPAILVPQVKKPFIYDHSTIVDVKFSSENRYVAYYDTSMAVCLLKRSDCKSQGFPDWVFHGRYIAHYKPVSDLLFCPVARLFSIGLDGSLVEYDVEKSEPGKLLLKSSTIIVQAGNPLSFIIYPLPLEKQRCEGLLFIISADDYKYYIVDVELNCLERTFLGPTTSIPTRKMAVVPHTENKILIYCTDRHLGIQLLPVSGNPFKRVAMILHPSKIESFKLSNCGKFVFTYGFEDNVCIMWNIIPSSVYFIRDIGGSELTPYYSLIEGGVNGWLFNEMKDLFYYMQILHDGEDSPLPRQSHEKIKIKELPNLIRAIGFFPSEDELENILSEVKYYYSTTNEHGVDEISFENFVKMYLNHRPVYRFYIQELEAAFYKFSTHNVIRSSDFIHILTTKGEPFTELTLLHCLSILMAMNNKNENYKPELDNILPSELKFSTLICDILGIDCTGGSDSSLY